MIIDKCEIVAIIKDKVKIVSYLVKTVADSSITEANSYMGIAIGFEKYSIKNRDLVERMAIGGYITNAVGIRYKRGVILRGRDIELRDIPTIQHKLLNSSTIIILCELRLKTNNNLIGYIALDSAMIERNISQRQLTDLRLAGNNVIELYNKYGKEGAKVLRV